MFWQITLHSITLLKLLLFSLILSASFIQTGSIGLSATHGKCDDLSIPSSFSFLVILAPLVASTWIVWTHKNNNLAKIKANLFNKNGGNLLKKKLSKRKRSAQQLIIYTAEDIKKATNNYSVTRAMHRCNPGTLYLGTLSNNVDTEVIVMKIQKVPNPLIEQFVDQLIFLSQPHRNVVKIIGCCLETSLPMLVYELHGKGNTLFDCIHGEAVRFSCKMRVKAAAGAARGLTYLQSSAKFVHGNICSDNILLDDSFDAKVFYTVPSNLNPWNVAQRINCVYKDPELIGSGRLHDKNDVYDFGVVLDELLTNFEHELISEEEIDLVKEVGMVAARCLSVKLEERPNMKEVEAKLTALINIK